MELLCNDNKVYTFENKLGDVVWEAEPITRFKFEKPVKNRHIKWLLKSNYPTAGIVFDGETYIGTNDGFIYTSNEKIQRFKKMIE